MTERGTEGLTARIRQIRRTIPSLAGTPEAETPRTDAARIKALENRLTDLEQLIQGLQDSVYREHQRQNDRLEELEARLDPSALAVALSKDARDRGL